jgi:hypothetical protein
MYDEDALEEDDESKKPPSTERQCPNCQRYVAVEAPYCPWCCKPFPEEKPRRRRD